MSKQHPSNEAAAKEVLKRNPDGTDPVSGKRIGDESVKELEKDMIAGATVADVDASLDSDGEQELESLLGDDDDSGL